MKPKRFSGDDIISTAHTHHDKNFSMKEVHYHLSNEITLIESGKTNIIIDDRIYTLESGDVFLIKKGTLHKNNGGAEHSSFTINFSREYMLQYLTEAGLNPLLKCFEREKLSLTSTAFGKALDAAARAVTARDKYPYIVTLLTLLCDETSIRPTVADISDPRIGGILNYIKRNYSTITGLDELAEHMHMSKSNLCKVVKRTAGITVSEYVNGVRINNACRILRDTDMNISETAAECGFDSVSYFGKVFRKIVHMSPGEFKRITRRGD